MAWPVPLDHASWIGAAWQRIAFVNAMLTAAAMRASAVSQAASGGAVTAELLTADANLQSAGQFNLLRPRDSVPSTVHVLDLAGGYAKDLAGTAAAGLAGSARWVDPTYIVLSEEWIEAQHALWTPGDGFTDLFLELVNMKLGGWGLDPMGSSLIAGDIPWTRKYGIAAAPDVDYGPVAVGDIIGEWIFNEWRAVLEVLNAIARDPSWETPDTWIVWEGTANGETDCEDAKATVTSTWENARTRAVSPIVDPPAAVSATGSVSYEAGEGFYGSMVRSWVEYNIVNCDVVDNGVWKIFIHARKFGDTFEDFDDTGWEEDTIGQIEETASDPFVFSPAPFKDPSTDDEEIQRVPCPVEEGDPPESDYNSIGYVLDDAPQMVVVLSYPAP